MLKTVIASVMALTVAGVSLPALTQGEKEARHAQEKPSAQVEDADKLYAQVKQARADLRELRIQAGLHAHPAGAHIDPEGHHVNDSPAQRERERGEKAGHEDGGGEGSRESGGEGRGERGHEGGREGSGEHGSRREHEGREVRERGEHGGGSEVGGEGAKNRIAKGAKHDRVYENGAHLILAYNPNTQAFVGSVHNTTSKPLSEMRVEIHLSNGMELGPTKRVDMKPGQTIPVELGAFGQRFDSWVTHPEAGVEAGHGSGGEEGGAAHEARERGEHGGRGDGRREGGERGGEHGGREGGEGSEGRGDKPGNASMLPVYNQILLLKGEMHAFKADLAAKNKG